jgi:hypothetical protein
MPTTQTIVVTGALAVIIGGAGYFIGAHRDPGVNITMRGKDGEQHILNLNGSPIDVSEGSVNVSVRFGVTVMGGAAKIPKLVFRAKLFELVNCNPGLPLNRCQVDISSAPWAAKLTRGGATVDDIAEDNVGNVVFTPADPAYPFTQGTSLHAYQNTSFDAATVNNVTPPLSCLDSSDPPHCEFKILYCLVSSLPCN